MKLTFTFISAFLIFAAIGLVGYYWWLLLLFIIDHVERTSGGIMHIYAAICYVSFTLAIIMTVRYRQMQNGNDDESPS